MPWLHSRRWEILFAVGDDAACLTAYRTARDSRLKKATLYQPVYDGRGYEV